MDDLFCSSEQRVWYLYGVQLKEGLVVGMYWVAGQHHYGEEDRRAEEREAERPVGEELRKHRGDGSGFGEAPEDGRSEGENTDAIEKARA